MENARLQVYLDHQVRRADRITHRPTPSAGLKLGLPQIGAAAVEAIGLLLASDHHYRSLQQKTSGIPLGSEKLQYPHTKQA
jgi:hypothetical protein